MGFKRKFVWKQGFFWGILAGQLIIVGTTQILRYLDVLEGGSGGRWEAFTGVFIMALLFGLMGFQWGCLKGYSDSTRDYMGAFGIKVDL
jgi:hypothetical protein